jgi:apolipoprotein N-acyltransferase
VIALALGLLQSGLMFAAYGTPSLWFLALAVPLPALWLGMSGAVNWKRAGLFAIGTAPFWAFSHAFIGEITAAGVAPLAVYLSLWPGLCVWALSRATRESWTSGRWWACVLAAGAVWVGLDVIRGEIIFGGYAWYLAGEPLIEFFPLAAAGAVVGLYGVGLLVVLVAACVVQAAVRCSTRPLLGVVIIAVVWGTLSAVGSRGPEGGVDVRVAIVQTNVPQSNKLAWSSGKAQADFERLLTLSIVAGRANPDLIIWPETMKAGWVLTDGQIAETRALLAEHPELAGLENEITRAELVRAVVKRTGVPTMVGQETIDGLSFAKVNGRWRERYRARYNSSYVVLGDGSVWTGRYDKLEPTPFGETIPYASHWPWLRDKLLDLAAGGMRVDLASGVEPTVFPVPLGSRPGVGGSKTDTLRVVTPICFESTDADHVGALVGGLSGRRADLIACMTNDGWFAGQVSGRESHLRLGRWRCLELATPMARAANTGLSALIDHHGRFVEPDSAAASALGLEGVPPRTFDRDGVIVGTLRTGAALSWYGRLGDLAGWGCLGGLIGMSLRTAWRAFKRRRDRKAEESTRAA